MAGPDVKALKLTPLHGCGIERLLAAYSAALTAHGLVKGYAGLKALVRDSALHLTAMLSALGLRADVETRRLRVSNRELQVTFVSLVDCECRVDAREAEGGILVNVVCSGCRGGGVQSLSYEFRVELDH